MFWIYRAISVGKTGCWFSKDWNCPSPFSSTVSNHISCGCQNINEPDTWIYKTLPKVQRNVMDQVEKYYLDMALKKTNGRINQPAQMAGIDPRGFFNKMKRLGLRKKDFWNSRRQWVLLRTSNAYRVIHTPNFFNALLSGSGPLWFLDSEPVSFEENIRAKQ